MAEKKPLPAGRIIGASIMGGLIAGGIALYVSGGLDGNTPEQAVADSCPAKTDLARRVAAAATGEVAAMLPADPPRALSTLAFKGADEKPLTLADFAGRTVLVNLWATWCAPCRAEMPALDELERSLGGESFEVVAINIDTGSDEKPRAFLDETGVSSLGWYRDSSMGVFNDLKRQSLAVGLPVSLLVDGDGCLLAHMNGPAEWSGTDAHRLIETALSGAEPTQ